MKRERKEWREKEKNEKKMALDRWWKGLDNKTNKKKMALDRWWKGLDNKTNKINWGYKPRTNLDNTKRAIMTKQTKQNKMIEGFESQDNIQITTLK